MSALGHTEASRQLVRDGVERPSTLALASLSPEHRAAVEAFAAEAKRSSKYRVTLSDTDKDRVSGPILAAVKAYFDAFAERGVK